MSEKKKKSYNMSVVNGREFFAHEVTVNFTPLQFMLDFKSITPRKDPRGQGGKNVFVMRHNVVMVNPWHAKKMHDLLGRVIENYEEEFGEIEKPDAVEIAEEKKKAQVEDGDSETKKLPIYFG